MRRPFELAASPRVEHQISLLRKRAQRNPKVRQALLRTAKRIADLITLGGMWYGYTFEEREAKRMAYFAKWDWKPGDMMIYDPYGKPVRPFRAKGNTPEEQKAWTIAALRWAWHMIETEPLKWGRDRIEFSARAIPGVKQGTRLSKEQVAEVRERFGEDQFAFRVQVLHSYRRTATPQGKRAFAEWADSKVDLSLPVVTSEPVDRLDVEDDREATSAHDIFSSSEGRSRWHYVYLDGEITGIPVVTWKETDDSSDDEFDPGGYKRRADLYSPVTREEFAKAKAEEVARAQAMLERSKRRLRGETTPEEKEAFLRFMANIARAVPETGEVVAKRTTGTRSDGMRYSIRNGKAVLVPKEEVVAANRRRYEAILERRRRRYQPPEYPGYTVKQVGRLAGEKASVFTDDDIPEEVVSEREVRSSQLAEERRNKSALEQSAVDWERRATLAADINEVLMHQKDDVPESDYELLEESLHFFQTGEDPDADLDLDKAIAAVPELADSLAQMRARRSSNAPKGLIGAVAYERAKRGDRLNATLFTRGLSSLEAAVADDEPEDKKKEE